MKVSTILHGCLALTILAPLTWADPAAPPKLDLLQILRKVQEHQKQVESLREDYTYQSIETRQLLDSANQVKSSDTEEREQFFVNGHSIGRLVKKNEHLLSAGDQQKEDARVKSLVAKAQSTPSDQRLEGPSITVSRVLELVDLRNPRREVQRGRPTIVFDFVGRKDARTHGVMEDASKKLEGTVWIDEADLQVVHLDVIVRENFKIAGGLLASIEKGSTFRFDQAKVEDGLWLPVGSEANMQARLLLVKNIHQHVVQRDFGYKCFHVQTEEASNLPPQPPQIN